MGQYEAQYMFLMDFRDYIRSGKSTEIIDDLRRYFPDEYEVFMKAANKEEHSKQIAALLRGPKEG